jgi:lysophospholipase
MKGLSSILQLTSATGPGGGIISTAKYFADIYSAVDAKETAGFNTTITDYWGRGLSYQLVNAPDGGPGMECTAFFKDLC